MLFKKVNIRGRRGVNDMLMMRQGGCGGKGGGPPRKQQQQQHTDDTDDFLQDINYKKKYNEI